MENVLTINGIDYIKKDKIHVDKDMIEKALEQKNISIYNLLDVLETELNKELSQVCLCNDEVYELGSYENIDKVVLLSLIKTIR